MESPNVSHTSPSLGVSGGWTSLDLYVEDPLVAAEAQHILVPKDSTLEQLRGLLRQKFELPKTDFKILVGRDPLPNVLNEWMELTKDEMKKLRNESCLKLDLSVKKSNGLSFGGECRVVWVYKRGISKDWRRVRREDMQVAIDRTPRYLIASKTHCFPRIVNVDSLMKFGRIRIKGKEDQSALTGEKSAVEKEKKECQFEEFQMQKKILDGSKGTVEIVLLFELLDESNKVVTQIEVCAEEIC